MTLEQLVDMVKAFGDRRDRLYDSELQSLLAEVVAYIEDGEVGKGALRWIESVVQCFDRDDVQERRQTRPSGSGVNVFISYDKSARGRQIINSQRGKK